MVAKGFDMHGEPVIIEGSELLARAIQHETDHLDGILFVDRLDAETRKAAMKAIREAEWFGDAAARPSRMRPHPTYGLRVLGCRVDAARLRRARPRPPCRRCEAVAASRHELVGVVTRPDAPAGRGRRLVASPVGAARRGARRRRC